MLYMCILTMWETGFNTKSHVVMLHVFCVCNILELTHASQRFFAVQPYSRSVQNILATFSVATATHCAEKCLKHNQCNAYNVGAYVNSMDDALTCEIVQFDENLDHVLQQQSGWTVYTGEKIKY